MRDDLISKFTNKDVLLQTLAERSPVFRQAVSEFCAATKLKAAYHRNSLNQEFVGLYTDGGFYGGTLQLETTGYNRNRKPRFVYSGPLTWKEKSSAGSGRQQRDSEKITGLIATLKRKDEIPDNTRMSHRFMQGIGYGFKSCINGVVMPSFNVSNAESLALVEYFLGKEVHGVETHRTSIENTYELYLDKLEKVREARANLTRITAGAKIVGIVPNQMHSTRDPNEYVYWVGEAACEKDVVTLHAPLERYTTLSDSPLAADAAMIRTYANSQSWFDKDNELGIPMGDRFFDDIDVGVGYASHETGWWVVIPKNGA